MKWGLMIFIFLLVPVSAQNAAQPEIRVGESVTYQFSRLDQIYRHENGTESLQRNVSEVYNVLMRITDIRDHTVVVNDSTVMDFSCIGGFFIAPDWDFWTENLDNFCVLVDNSDLFYLIEAEIDANTRVFYHNYAKRESNQQYAYTHEYAASGVLTHLYGNISDSFNDIRLFTGYETKLVETKAVETETGFKIDLHFSPIWLITLLIARKLQKKKSKR